MKSRGLRLALVLLAVTALAGVGCLVYEAERRAEGVRQGQRDLQRDVARLQAVLGDMRAAHPAYVARAQDQEFWTAKVDGLLRDLGAGVNGLKRSGMTPTASQELATAAEAVTALRAHDNRLKDLVRQERAAEASRLVFADASALATTASVALSQALVAEGHAADAAVERLRRLQLYALGGAALLALVAMLLLAPVPAAAPPDEADAPHPPGDSAATRLFNSPLELDSLGKSGFDLDFRDAGAAVVTPPVAAAPARSTSPGETVAVESTAPPAIEASTTTQLEETARVCTELAQVADTDHLRQLLGRAASLLHASGIVVWLGGINGASLRPAFSHGYSEQALARMQAIGREDENAVSAAFRTGRVQAVRADERGTSAVVAPLLAPLGCLGAMAVELGDGVEQDDALHAVAQLVAAQLATLMPTEGVGARG
ncbi:MAG TPA: hypothetical protein VK911_15700 [Vicinamibacterales bacterium]|nr:hypothetical protein [Vicinamibacterales bacterium]